MSHTNKPQDPFALDHDTASHTPSKSSQPPIDMDTRSKVVTGSLWDHDGRVYLAKKYRTQIASGPAAFCSVIAGAPLENLKTRMQSKYFPNAWDCAKYTLRTEGIRGFWAGTLPPLLSLSVSRVGGFSVYQKAKYAIDAMMEKSIGISPLHTVNTTGTYPTIYTVSCFTLSGAISGATMSVFLAPFELVKNATQTSVLMSADVPRGAEPGSVPRGGSRIGTFQALKQVVERRGYRGLYIGFQLHMLRDTLGSALYFGVYEAIKQSMTSYWQMEKANTAGPVAVAGAVCGVVSWVATYPLDTMKTRVQNTLVGNASRNSQQKPLDLLTTSAVDNGSSKSGGVERVAKAAMASQRHSKWRGVEMIILRSSIQNMIQMLIFEGIKTRIIDTEFSSGSRDLPQMKRERGRDRKLM